MGDVVRVLEALSPEAVDRYKAGAHASAVELSAERLSLPWANHIAALAHGQGLT